MPGVCIFGYVPEHRYENLNNNNTMLSFGHKTVYTKNSLCIICIKKNCMLTIIIIIINKTSFWIQSMSVPVNIIHLQTRVDREIISDLYVLQIEIELHVLFRE